LIDNRPRIIRGYEVWTRHRRGRERERDPAAWRRASRRLPFGMEEVEEEVEKEDFFIDCKGSKSFGNTKSLETRFRQGLKHVRYRYD
jgi:hypothetical protein